MTIPTHTRCYQCGKVIPIEEAVRRNVTVGSSSVYGSTYGSTLGSTHGGYHSSGFISGSGSQVQRVDYCQRCAEAADRAAADQAAANRAAAAANRRMLGCIFAVIMGLMMTPFLAIMLYGGGCCVLAGLGGMGAASTERSEQKRKDDEARKEKEEAEAKVKEEEAKSKAAAELKAKADARAKAEAERIAGVKAEAATPEGKAKTERLEVEMVLYELAKAEYHAAVRLRTAREFMDSANTEKANGHLQASERLTKRGRERLLEVFNLYLETKAAKEAQQLLNGEIVSAHPVPAKPTLPKGVTADEDDMAGTNKPSPIKLPPDQALPTISVSGNHTNPVYVRSYTRPDGLAAQAHYRQVSGTGEPKGNP